MRIGKGMGEVSRGKKADISLLAEATTVRTSTHFRYDESVTMTHQRMGSKNDGQVLHSNISRRSAALLP